MHITVLAFQYGRTSCPTKTVCKLSVMIGFKKSALDVVGICWFECRFRTLHSWALD